MNFIIYNLHFQSALGTEKIITYFMHFYQKIKEMKAKATHKQHS